MWPMALYSADTAFLGMVHFQTLRSATLLAFVGKCNFASPWLACFALSKFLVDPLLHVVLSILRSIKRLFTLCKDTAYRIIHLAVGFGGSPPYGPASTSKRYLNILGWDIHPDATLVGPDYFSVSLMTPSKKSA